MISYSEACRDPNLFGDWFDGPSWDTWRVLDKALFGEPLSAEELAIYEELTGQTGYLPGVPCKEAWLIMGRRSGKDVKAASLITYLATIGAEAFELTKHAQPGETLVAQLVAVDRSQASVCLNYTKAFFEKPMLAAMVTRETADGLELSNGIAIQIATNDLKTVRGRTTIAAVLDECAFYSSVSSVNPDKELYRAIKPGMATVPNAMLIGISSPFTRTGLLFEKHEAHFGKAGRNLVAVAPSWRMNPTLDAEFLEEEKAADPVSFESEYGAKFRDSSSTLFSHETLNVVTDHGTAQRPFIANVKYFGFADAASGGSKGGDSFTASVAHVDTDGTVILDATYEITPPFSPKAAVAEVATFLKSYGLNSCVGDRYTGQIIREMFGAEGITYHASTANRSQLYLNLLPLVNARQIQLIDDPRMLTQLTQLIRKPATSTGREIIDHPQGASFHDDIANAAAGAAYAASRNLGRKPAKLAGPVFATANGFSAMPNGPTKPQAGQLFVRFNEMGNRRELTREEKDDDWQEFDRREAEAAKRPPVRQTYFG